MDGILNVYKEAGWTSFDVVAKLRGILKTKKIGHGGTLDPAVTGVLPVAVGKATRLLEYMEASGKIYEGEVTLGIATETEDAQGAVIAQKAVLSNLTEAEIDAAMATFLGKIQQVPPMYSAVKVNGKRLYEYARAGQIVERPVREIEIKDFVRSSSVKFDSVAQTASFTFRVACSKGTYVRTLAVDLAAKLGYPGHMSSLQRTMANGLELAHSLSLAQIQAAQENGSLAEIFYPLDYAVSELARLDLDSVKFDRVRVGKFFEENEFDQVLMAENQQFALFYEQNLVAIYIKHPTQQGVLKPSKVLI